MTNQFFSEASALSDSDLPFATAIVVHADKPTSAKPGDKAIVTIKGVMHGWIGGSCAQPLVIEESKKALATGKPRFIRLSPNPENLSPRDGLIDLPLTCFSGGTLEIYIEPHLPLPRLMIVGVLPVAQALARIGKAMDYRVIAVDLETEIDDSIEFDEVIRDIGLVTEAITPLTYVVVASHGNYDELVLERVLPSNAAYVALVASSKRASAVIECLAAQGLAEDDIARLKYPAGLDIQAQQGDEIAVSIMAEIVQRRRNLSGIDLDSLIESMSQADDETDAYDPVCGMSVQIDGALDWFDYEEQTYYFCCTKCKTMFSESPTKYIETINPSGEAIDPVCKMTVDIATARYMSEHEGTFYYFCAAGCKKSFDEKPASFVRLISIDSISTME